MNFEVNRTLLSCFLLGGVMSVGLYSWVSEPGDNESLTLGRWAGSAAAQEEG